jgi:hypothetical protein
VVLVSGFLAIIDALMIMVTVTISEQTSAPKMTLRVCVHLCTRSTVRHDDDDDAPLRRSAQVHTGRSSF